MATQPNVLLLMCDQLNASVLGCYGGPVPTPNLDRLAAQGVRFTDATCPTPFCSPSRASIVTGQYPHTHGIVHNVNRRDYPAIPAQPTEAGIQTRDRITDAVLAEAGWATHHYGKWHLLDDDLPCYPDMFGEHHGYAAEMAETFAAVRQRPGGEWLDWYGWALPTTRSAPLREAVAKLAGRWDDKVHAPFITKMGRLDLPVEQNFDVRVADHVVRAVGELPEPFSLTGSFNYPHDPNVVPSPYYERIDPAALDLPANFDSREARFEGDWSRQVVTDLGEGALLEFLRIYYASVALIDDQVGRILDALEASGRADDTLVIFLADHGDMAGGHGMVWKSTGSFYDEVARVPLIVRYPGHVPAGATAGPACLTDILPTILDYAGQRLPDGVQGLSLRPQLEGQPRDRYTFSERVPANRDRTRTLSADAVGQFMVRGQGWKYVVYANGDAYLYDLAADPGETRNVIEAHPERVALMRAALRDWLGRTGWPGAAVAGP